MSSVSLDKRGLSPPHYLCKVKLDRPQPAGRDWCESGTLVGELAFVKTGLLRVTGFLAVC